MAVGVSTTGFVSVPKVTQILESKAMYWTTMRKAIFGDSYISRQGNTFSLADFVDTSTNIACSDSGYVSIGGTTDTVKHIQPLEIKQSYDVSATDILNMQYALGGSTNGVMSDMAARKVMNFMDNASRSIEAMISTQVTTGALAYYEQTQGGSANTDYAINFGLSSPSVTITGTWSGATKTIGDIYEDLMLMDEAMMQDYNMLGERICFASTEAYKTFYDKITALPNDTRIEARIYDDYIQVGKFKIIRVLGTYLNKSGTATRHMPANSFAMVDKGYAAHSMNFLSVANFKAGFSSSPLWWKAMENANGDAVKILTHTRPLPFIDQRGVIFESDVVT